MIVDGPPPNGGDDDLVGCIVFQQDGRTRTTECLRDIADDVLKESVKIQVCIDPLGHALKQEEFLYQLILVFSHSSYSSLPGHSGLPDGGLTAVGCVGHSVKEGTARSGVCSAKSGRVINTGGGAGTSRGAQVTRSGHLQRYDGKVGTRTRKERKIAMVDLALDALSYGASNSANQMQSC
jgi:hypothetical protein